MTTETVSSYALHSIGSFIAKSYGKQLVQGVLISPVFEVFDRIVFETGGGIWKRHGLTDSIYITQQQVQYVGSIEKYVVQVNKELGDTRRAIKI
ncbi:MAG: hypothetical protein KAT54_04885 [Candidatus Marinimicrobia bacterium]|nr:hypothetical protein [Candidatus Neomarinimicrobiota bacterium]